MSPPKEGESASWQPLQPKGLSPTHTSDQRHHEVLGAAQSAAATEGQCVGLDLHRQELILRGARHDAWHLT